jgi:hypothetical protein
LINADIWRFGKGRKFGTVFTRIRTEILTYEPYGKLSSASDASDLMAISDCNSVMYATNQISMGMLLGSKKLRKGNLRLWKL